MTPGGIARFAAALMITAAVAGCGSASGNPSSSSLSPAQARSEVLAAYHALYDQNLYRPRVGYAYAVSGSYQGCKANKSDALYEGVTTLYPFRRMSPQAFAQSVAGAMRRGGWTLTRQQPPAQATGQVAYYTIAKGSVTGDMYTAASGPASAQAALGITSGCFSGTLLKSSAAGRFGTFPLAHPSPAPS
jgi:hypothetical protein